MGTLNILLQQLNENNSITTIESFDKDIVLCYLYLVIDYSISLNFIVEENFDGCKSLKGTADQLNNIVKPLFKDLLYCVDQNDNVKQLVESVIDHFDKSVANFLAKILNKTYEPAICKSELIKLYNKLK